MEANTTPPRKVIDAETLVFITRVAAAFEMEPQWSEGSEFWYIMSTEQQDRKGFSFWWDSNSSVEDFFRSLRNTLHEEAFSSIRSW